MKIDPHNFELCRFKVCAFFETQCITSTQMFIKQNSLLINQITQRKTTTVKLQAWWGSWNRGTGQRETI